MELVTKMKARQIHFLGILGLDLIRLITNLRFFGRFIREVAEFRKMGGEISELWPILHDYKAFGGTSNGHYFHQDLLVASYIFERNPNLHIDIGSRVDGFVAHVATFRHIVVLDINETPETNHKNITFKKLDMMNPLSLSKTDSLSCLHAIEHFGLGRYGDPIDPTGHIKGFQNLIQMLNKGGILYISFPISTEPRVVFNAHRIFHPLDILNWTGCENLTLRRFDYVDDEGDLHRQVNLKNLTGGIAYGCGIYTFSKN